MPRRIDHLHPGVLPDKPRFLGINRDPALPFLDIVIQHGVFLSTRPDRRIIPLVYSRLSINVVFPAST